MKIFSPTVVGKCFNFATSTPSRHAVTNQRPLSLESPVQRVDSELNRPGQCQKTSSKSSFTPSFGSYTHLSSVSKVKRKYEPLVIASSDDENSPHLVRKRKKSVIPSEFPNTPGGLSRIFERNERRKSVILQKGQQLPTTSNGTSKKEKKSKITTSDKRSKSSTKSNEEKGEEKDRSRRGIKRGPSKSPVTDHPLLKRLCQSNELVVMRRKEGTSRHPLTPLNHPPLFKVPMTQEGKKKNSPAITLTKIPKKQSQGNIQPLPTPSTHPKRNLRSNQKASRNRNLETSKESVEEEVVIKTKAKVSVCHWKDLEWKCMSSFKGVSFSKTAKCSEALTGFINLDPQASFTRTSPCSQVFTVQSGMGMLAFQGNNIKLLCKSTCFIPQGVEYKVENTSKAKPLILSYVKLVSEPHQ